MAYTNGNGQTRVGVRIVPLSVVIPTISALLDSYSGASAAYSLRKLSATYTGSAIRVRRSSDNTEQDIGFDSNGNLDTVALSTFVGSGSGFVTTWYDQTGNNFNRTQTTAAGQPNIVYLGAINMVNGKPAIYFDPNVGFALQGPKIGETYQGAGYSSTVLNVTKLDSSYSTTEEYPLFGGTGWYDSRFSIYNNKWYLINTGTGISSTVNASANQVVSSVVFEYTTDKVRINGTEVISGNVGINGGTGYNYIGQSWLGKRYKGYFQEHIIYASDKTSVISAMETNMNTYYSAYPNPTSVWNLLNAVYSADTKASPSLKTSLVAAYNGESNTNDSFGSNNGTAVGGVTYTAGKIGNAFTLNGSNAYVSLPNNSLNPSGDFTISLWVKFNSVAATYINLIENYYNPSYNSRYGFNMYLQSGKIKFATYDGSITNIAQSTTTFVVNQWYQIVLSKKLNTAPKLYVNGLNETFAQVGGNISNNIVYNSLCKSLFGVDFDYSVSYNSFLNGSLDAINIWNKELTASEVSELYNSGNGAQYIGDNFYKPTTNDAVGTNNGTAQGGLTYGLGKVGTAFQFNGTNAYVDYGDNFDLGLSSWSYSFWTIPTSLIGERTFFSKSVAGAMDGRFFAFAYHDFFKVGMQVATIGGAPNIIEVISANVIPTSWTMMTIVFDRSDKIKCYFNGNQIAMTTLTGTNNLLPYSAINYNTSAPFRIGAYTAFDGVTPMLFAQNKMDAFNIWNRALTQSEITELYNSGNGKQYPN